ncbi:preflagellin peptidase FlaK [Halorubrum alkaliphilum]|uniref:Preflagellin peptidase FlaK n=1 Tax=Halorubrum alkaliphilum TaxID=261290 RepID=A0A8T4GB20_9EURY|nr:A24 family peptidase [Halorubrum alkaliphilum]MBP1921628.1 preflagellin peptidase FlaK [Halorubrum alkaliphilum]
MFPTLPDVLRLLVVPVFLWAAVRDVRTRRLPNWLWPPLYAFGVLLVLVEAVRFAPFAGFEGRLFLVQTLISLFLVAPLGYAFWYLGAFGGADAKALIAIAVLFPTFPTYEIAGATLPYVETALGVFSLTVLTNTVLIGLAYPVGLALYNLTTGERSATMFLARPVTTPSLSKRHGRLFEDTSGTTRNGLDLDALRMYLRWRGLTLSELRADSDALRDPESVTETYEPTDGGTHVGPATDGGEPIPDDLSTVGDVAASETFDDPWAADRFLAEIERGAYGTDAETLREGLEVVASRESVMVSPGMPFVVPMAAGLVVSLTYGDVLFAFLAVLGLV